MRRRLGLVLGVSACGLLLPLAPNGLIVSRPLARADVIVVMAGSGAYEERASTAARLFRERRAAQLVLTDEGTLAGWSEAIQRNPSFAELTLARLVREGVPSSAIVTLPVPPHGRATRTLDEALALDLWARRHDVRSLLLVTSACHARRAVAAFEDEAGVSVGLVTAASDVCGPWWWLSARGWRTIASEYVKLGYQRAASFAH